MDFAMRPLATAVTAGLLLVGCSGSDFAGGGVTIAKEKKGASACDAAECDDGAGDDPLQEDTDEKTKGPSGDPTDGSSSSDSPSLDWTDEDLEIASVDLATDQDTVALGRWSLCVLSYFGYGASGSNDALCKVANTDDDWTLSKTLRAAGSVACKATCVRRRAGAAALKLSRHAITYPKTEAMDAAACFLVEVGIESGDATGSTTACAIEAVKDGQWRLGATSSRGAGTVSCEAVCVDTLPAAFAAGKSASHKSTGGQKWEYAPVGGATDRSFCGALAFGFETSGGNAGTVGVSVSRSDDGWQVGSASPLAGQASIVGGCISRKE